MSEMVDQESVQKEIQLELSDPKLYINREMSLLEFQHRVLEEAQDNTNPLLERVKFLAIVGSNMDEFYMVRVAGLKRQVDAGVIEASPDGIPPVEQLAEIRKISWKLMSEAHAYLLEPLLPELETNGIHILDYMDLSKTQKDYVDHYFEEVVFPVLTPLALDPAHPFPHISNLSMNLAITLEDQFGQERFARLKVPGTLPRLLPIKRSSGSVRKDGTVPYHHYFVWLEQVIAANLDKLFPGLELREIFPFRVIRDADQIIQELEADDLLETTEQTVRQRRFGTVVNLTVPDAMPAQLRNILVENLEVDPKDVYTLNGPLGLSNILSLHNIDRYDLKDPTFKPTVPVRLSEAGHDSNIFTALRRGDITLHHPYQSFTPVIEFLTAAAARSGRLSH